jgi:hypothetical protein
LENLLAGETRQPRNAGIILHSTDMQLRDGNLPFDHLRLAPTAFLIEGNPAPLFAAIVPILIKLKINQNPARL